MANLYNALLNSTTTPLIAPGMAAKMAGPCVSPRVSGIVAAAPSPAAMAAPAALAEQVSALGPALEPVQLAAAPSPAAVAAPAAPAEQVSARGHAPGEEAVPMQPVPRKAPVTIVGIILIIFALSIALIFVGSLGGVLFLIIKGKEVNPILTNLLTSSFTFIAGVLSANLGLKQQLQI